MTELSPAAKAVLNAYEKANDCYREEWGQLAAALRAVADQVVPDPITWQSLSEQARHWPSAEYRAGEQGMAFVVRRKLRLIAAELDAQ